MCKRLTVSYNAQYGQIDQSFPVGSFLQGDTVTRGGKNVAAADGHQFTAVVSAGHVVQHRGVIDEGIQLSVKGTHIQEKTFPCDGKKKEGGGGVSGFSVENNDNETSLVNLVIYIHCHRLCSSDPQTNFDCSQ